MRLYYLTSAQNAISNIALRRVKISRFSELNDPFELLAVDLADKKSRALFRAKREEIDKTKGLVCLSKNWKSPLMWGHYADRHRGMALGFEVPDHRVVDVLYRPHLEKAVVNLKSKRPSTQLTAELLRIKFEDWKYENEMRLFLPLSERACEGGLYFESFSDELQLREVVLGPKCTVPINAVRSLASTYKNKIDVIQARIAFTRFEVLTSLAATRADKGLTSGSSRLAKKPAGGLT